MKKSYLIIFARMKRTPKTKPNRLPPLLHAILSLTLSLVLMAGSCKKEQTGLEALPAATQEGKNTFGCLVNGQAHIGRASPGQKNPLSCTYSYNAVTRTYYFTLQGSDYKQNPHRTIWITIAPPNTGLTGGQTYTLKYEGDKGTYGEYDFNDIPNPVAYYSITGEMHLSRFDIPNQIVSGTFWFDAANAKGEKVAIRDGRFDMRFTPYQTN